MKTRIMMVVLFIVALFQPTSNATAAEDSVPEWKIEQAGAGLAVQVLAKNWVITTTDSSVAFYVSFPECCDILGQNNAKFEQIKEKAKIRLREIINKGGNDAFMLFLSKMEWAAAFSNIGQKENITPKQVATFYLGGIDKNINLIESIEEDWGKEWTDLVQELTQ